MKEIKEKEYTSEKEFLAHYDSSMFEKLSLTADTLVFSVSEEHQDNYRKLNEKYFSVLLVKRNTYPYKDKWCLPGGFVDIKESIYDAATRILAREANLHDIYMEQLYTYGDVKRDPRMRVVSTAYMALIDKNQIEDSLADNASWFNIVSVEEVEQKDKSIDITYVLNNGEEDIVIKCNKKRVSPKGEHYTYTITENKKLAFDHAKVIVQGRERLKNKIEYTDIVFNMMPEYFTLGELQQVYEAILGKKLLDPAFRRIIEKKVVKTTKLKKGEGHRPSALFKYANR